MLDKVRMNEQTELYVFGEVLLDCFPTGEQVLGGAPFNVAWHLQAFGDRPLFISRVGKDAHGSKILEAMRAWGMESRAIQVDATHPTGRVEVSIANNEPSYDIVADSAYDFIAAAELPRHFNSGILYHGTLALRHPTAFEAFCSVSQNRQLKIFLDVNLRSPWWQKERVLGMLHTAHWAKMNEQELLLLAGPEADIHKQMAALQGQCNLEHLIITQGARGALVRTASGKIYAFEPEMAAHVVDTVGAGDAFSAVYIHGLQAGWPIGEIGKRAQTFASKIIGLRGATTTDYKFYQNVMNSLVTFTS